MDGLLPVSVASGCGSGLLTWATPRRLPWLGALLLWMSTDPLGLWLTGWIALVPWIVLTHPAVTLQRRDYCQFWLAGSVFWLLALYGLCFAHPAMFLGWLTLGGYLGVYPALFVGLVRVARSLAIPAIVAAPSIWIGLECIRSYAFTGLSVCQLGHSQVTLPVILQVADIGGSYAVGFVVASVATALAIWIETRHPLLRGRDAGDSEVDPHASDRQWEVTKLSTIDRRPLVASALAGGLLLATLAYGLWRLGQTPAGSEAQSLGIAIALIQRNERTEYIMPSERYSQIFMAYVRGSQVAMADSPEQKIDLVVWPESMFSVGTPWMVLAENATSGEELGLTPQQRDMLIAERNEAFRQQAAGLQRQLAIAGDQAELPALLLGCGVVGFAERMHSYSGAIWVDRASEVTQWYGKRHLVMFGEYIPLLEWVPALFDYLPAPRVTPGTEFRTMQLGDVRIAPNICFETAVEHATINQIRQLAAVDQAPDVIVNLTNDAWFNGSAVLDHHRRCSIMAAVGTRRPLLMASNTGPTCWIDGCGRVMGEIDKQTDGHVIARPTRDNRWGPYQWWSDRPIWLPVGFVIFCGGIGWRQRNTRPV